MKTIQKLGIVGLLMAFSIIGALSSMEQTNEQIGISDVTPEDNGVTNINYKGHVTIWKTEAKTGIKTLVADADNLIVNNGLEYIKMQIGNGNAIASNSTKWISLSNDTSSPDAAWTVIPAEINANGLARASSTYATNGTGKWNYTYEWTATDSQSARLTGLNYDSTPASDGNLFASLVFTPQSLLVNDKLLIVWSISVS